MGIVVKRNEFMKNSLMLLLLPVFLFCYGNAMAQEQPVQKRHGLSVSSFIGVEAWEDFVAPVLMVGYAQRKNRIVSVTPRAMAGAGMFENWGTRQERFSFVIFLEGGIETTIDAQYVAVKNFTNIVANYSPAQWGGSNLSIGPSITFAISTGSSIENWELSLYLPGIDFYLLGFNFRPARSEFDLVGGTLRVTGLNFVYYFPASNR